MIKPGAAEFLPLEHSEVTHRESLECMNALQLFKTRLFSFASYASVGKRLFAVQAAFFARMHLPIMENALSYDDILGGNLEIL